MSAPVPLPKEKGNFMANLLEDGPGHERDHYIQYVKQLKGETVNRFLEKYLWHKQIFRIGSGA